MAIGKTNAGAGGTNPLNFKVVDGTVSPTNPKENTIWVKTDIDIPYWTTASSANAPAYVAKKGAVNFWWESATSSEVSGTTAAGFMPVKYKATNPPGYMRLKPINCYQNHDGTASGWKRMNAYIYKSGNWVQFSAEFAATIATTFPEGSTCVCSDGITTITAPNTSGSYTFVVPNTGTWTLTCTDGTDTATDTVEITADGQSESVELSYILYLYKSGDQSGWTEYDPSSKFTLTYEENTMKTHMSAWCSQAGYNAYAYKDVKLSGKKTLKVTISSAWFSAVSANDANNCGTFADIHVFQGDTKVAGTRDGWGNATTSGKSYGKETQTIDISGLSGEFQVRIHHNVYIYNNTAAQVQGQLYITEISAE